MGMKNTLSESKYIEGYITNIPILKSGYAKQTAESLDLTICDWMKVGEETMAIP